MRRYYFNVVSNTEMFPDDDGMLLTDDAAAHRYAIHLVFKTMQFDPDAEDWRGWRIDVLDAERRFVLAVLYPSRMPAIRKTFGMRKEKPLNILDVICIACGSIVLCLHSSQAVGANTLSCVTTGSSFTCVANSPASSGSIARVLDIEIHGERVDQARRAERERQWLARCRPVPREDRYGVLRYQYSASGCSFGKTQD